MSIKKVEDDEHKKIKRARIYQQNKRGEKISIIAETLEESKNEKNKVILENSLTTINNDGVITKIFAGHAKDNGLIVRAIGDIIAFCPPLIITDSQINDMFDIVEESLKKTMDELTKQGLLK